jgi:tetratricopeptide (TPR) repeat protein
MKMNLSYILADDRQYDRAIELRDEALAIRPDYWEAWRNIWLTFLRARRYTDATQAMTKWTNGFGADPQAANRLSQLLEQRDTTSEMIKIPAELLNELEIGSHIQAQVYAAVGDAEATLAALRIALDERAGSRSVLSMKINPLYDFVREDERFKEMLKEAGLTP